MHSVSGLLLFGFFSLLATEAKADLQYTVRENDTLSDILSRFDLRPIYGKNGKLIQTLRRNPGLLDQGNRIFPGRVIVIPGVPSREESRITRSSWEPVRAPASVSPPEEKGFHTYSQFSIRPRHHYYRLDSTDSVNQSKAVLRSGQSLGLEARGDWQWSERLRTGFNASYQALEMFRASVGTLNNSKGSFGAYDVHVGYRVNHWLNAEAFAGLENRLFSRGEAVSIATLESLQLLQYGVRLRGSLASKDSLGFILGVDLKRLGSYEAGAYRVNSSFEYLVMPTLRQNLGRSQVEFSAILGENSMQSSISDQVTQVLGVQLGVSFEVGK
jgi:hypothetical protein